MKRTGAEIIVKLLERQGIRILSGIPGGANLPIYDALRDSKIRHVLARHEQGAGFMAQGMARTTGRAAVCIATSGPGATNLLTAIADAKLDSIPIIAITGQVPISMIGTDAFQEVDVCGLTMPITKHNYLVRQGRELLEVIPQAFEIAESGRPGPVVIDIPKDIQLEEVEFDEWPHPGAPKPPLPSAPSDIDRIAEMIHQAERPVLYIGGGIIASGASKELTSLACKNSIPVTSSLMGLGCFPSDHPLYLGLIGMHAAKHCSLVLEDSDLLLAFGVRFDDRATGKAEEFCRHASIVHVDIDRSEIDKIKSANHSVVSDIGETLRGLLPLIQENDRTKWRQRVRHLKAEFPLNLPETSDHLHPLNLLRCISETAAPDTIITTDVGQHQMWTAQIYPFRCPRSFLTSGGLGTMGFGMPAATGAALANPGRRVICISGDGSFLMNIQELATMAEQDLDVTIVIFNNGHLGLVRQQQELFFQKRVYASKFTSRPDFAAIARGFGIRGRRLSSGQDIMDSLARALCERGPSVIDVPIDFAQNVYPMVPPGAANRNMIESANQL